MKNLSKAELLELFDVMAPKANQRLGEINRELKIRLDEISKMSEQLTREGVRSLEEVNSLLEEVEQHNSRVQVLKKEGDQILMDFLMDMEAINRAE